MFVIKRTLASNEACKNPRGGNELIAYTVGRGGLPLRPEIFPVPSKLPDFNVPGALQAFVREHGPKQMCPLTAVQIVQACNLALHKDRTRTLLKSTRPELRQSLIVGNGEVLPYNQEAVGRSDRRFSPALIRRTIPGVQLELPDDALIQELTYARQPNGLPKPVGLISAGPPELPHPIYVLARLGEITIVPAVAETQ